MKFSAFLPLVCASLISLGRAVPGERRLHGDLLAGYNKQVRPVLNESDTVHASIGVSFIEFMLDSDTALLQSLVWLRMKWNDQYLRWQPSEYDGIKTSMFNPRDIWVPDVCLYNSWERTCQLALTNSNAIVSSEGSVLFIPPARLTSRCELDRTNWPRDEARCHFKFGSWTYHGFLVNLTLYDSSGMPDMSDLRDNMHWEIVNSSGVLEKKMYSCCKEPYFSYTATLWLRRNEHRTAELSMPIVCATVLMLLSFLVPLSSPQKLTFCWVSLLICILGLLNAFTNMPLDAHGTATIASFYVTLTTLLLLAALLETLLVRLARPRATPLPRTLRSVLSGVAGRLLCLDTPLLRDYTAEDNEMLDSSPEAQLQKTTSPVSGRGCEWAVLAAAADRLCGLAFLLLFAVMVPPNITWSQ